MYLKAGGAHGDADIRQQGAEVFPFQRPGPALDEDVPPAHGAQHGAAHLDWDEVGAPLLLGQTREHSRALLKGPVLSPSPAASSSWWNINRGLFFFIYLEAHFGRKRVFLCVIETLVQPHGLRL